jgi:hypothetical protein
VQPDGEERNRHSIEDTSWLNEQSLR